MTIHFTDKTDSAVDFETWPDQDHEVTIGDIRMLCLPAGKVDICARRASHTINMVLNSNRAILAYNSDTAESLTISSGSMGFFPKGSTLRLQCENTVPELLIEIGDKTIHDWKEASGLTDLNAFDEQNPYRTDAVAAELARMGIQYLSNRQAGTPADKLMCEALVLGASARFVAVAEAAASRKPEAGGSTWSKRHGKERLRRSVEYAFEHLSDPNLRIADMARVASISSCQYTEVFKETYGCTPYAFVKEERLKHAKDLILHSTLPLSEIAYLCAFSDQSHMSAALKGRFGVSPGKLRR